MTKSRVLKKLRAGEFVTVAGFSRLPDPWYAEVIGRIGFDLIWFDMEHRPFGYDAIGPISFACRASGIDLMVRVLKTGYSRPCACSSSAPTESWSRIASMRREARQWVDWTRFPPLGRRGFDGSGADADFSWPIRANTSGTPMRRRSWCCRSKIAPPSSVSKTLPPCPASACSLSARRIFPIDYGVPWQFKHPLIETAFDRVAEAAARHGKYWGTVSGSPERAQWILDRGGRMFTAGGRSRRAGQRAESLFRLSRLRRHCEVIPSAGAPNARKWQVLALLFCAGGLNYADRTAISTLFPLLRADLAMTDVGMAAVGSLFLWSYAATSPIAGIVADRSRAAA